MAFNVQITNKPPRDIEAGETLTIPATVENTGAEPATQRIALTVGDSERDSQEVNLENGQSTDITLSWQTGPGDGGEYGVAVSSADDTDTTVANVASDPDVPVSITGTNAPITEGESLHVDVEVQNLKGDTIAQTIVGALSDPSYEDKITDKAADTERVVLDPNETRDVALEIGPGDYEETATNYQREIWVGSESDTASTTVSVSKPAIFDVTVDSTNAPVEASEKIKLTATVENTGGEIGDATVALAAKQYVNSISNAGSLSGPETGDGSGDDTDSTGVRLEPGQSQQVTLEWDTEPGDAGEHVLNAVAIPPWERDEWDGPVFADYGTDPHVDLAVHFPAMGTGMSRAGSDSSVVAVDRHGPMKTGRFIVKIDDVKVAGWKTVSIPSRSTEQGEYREGNDADYEKKVWGQTTWDDLEMERGVKPGDTRLHDWHESIVSGQADSGRKSVTVNLQDEEGNPMIQWQFQDAWIKDYDPPELDASADGDIATESITVAYDKMERKEV